MGFLQLEQSLSLDTDLIAGPIRCCGDHGKRFISCPSARHPLIDLSTRPWVAEGIRAARPNVRTAPCGEPSLTRAHVMSDCYIPLDPGRVAKQSCKLLHAGAVNLKKNPPIREVVCFASRLQLVAGSQSVSDACITSIDRRWHDSVRRSTPSAHSSWTSCRRYGRSFRCGLLAAFLLCHCLACRCVPLSCIMVLSRMS